MNDLRKAALGVAMAFACVAGAQAQGRGGAGVELTAAHAHDEWGAELGVGYSLKLGSIAVRPIGGMCITPAEDDGNGYYRDTFSNGQSRCRAPNGQFARDELCSGPGVSIDWYAKGELVYESATGFEIGGGGRLSSEKIRPYGTAAFAVSPKFKIKGNVGERYYAAGLTLGF